MSVNHSVSPDSDESGKQFLYPDRDLDRQQNLTNCSLVHCQLSLKIAWKSVRKFWRKVAIYRPNRQTDNDDYRTLAEVTIRLIFLVTTAPARLCY